MKKIYFLLILSLLFALPIQAQNLPTIPKNPDRPTVAVVLSGGGAKGFSHVGVLKVLEEEGIPIDLIVGTSIGSLVGGFYASGYSADSLLYLIHQQNWDSLLVDAVDRKYLPTTDKTTQQRYLLSLPIKERKILIPQGAMKGQNIINLFSGLTANFPSGSDFMDLPIPFACITADIATGEEIILTKGNLPYAMYSSMAIPGVFEPARIGDQVLVDGGIVNNFPVDVARNMGADIIIGVDLRDDYFTAEQINSVGDVISNLINIYSKGKDIYLPLCDVRIQPDITGYTAASFSQEACDTLYVRGFNAAQEQIGKIRSLKKKLNLPDPEKTSEKYIKKNEWKVSEIEFDCDKNYNYEFLSKVLNLPLNESYNYSEIKEAIDKLYGLGSFKSIYFNLDQIEGKDEYTLVLHIKSEATTRQNIGLRVNTTDIASLLVNLTWKDYSKAIGYVSLSAELSANPGFQAIAETNWQHLPDLGFMVNIKSQDYTIYTKDHNYKTDLVYTYAKAYLEERLNFFRMGLSIQEEFYHRNAPISTKYLFTSLRAYFRADNLDDFYFPLRGTNTRVDFTTDIDNLDSGSLTSHLLLSTENWIPLDKNLTLIANGYSRIALGLNYSGIKSTLIGGESYSRYLPYHFPFLGLPPVIVGEANTAIACIGLRLNFAKYHYLTLQFNMLQQFDSSFMYLDEKSVYGGGIKYSMKTAIGPIDIAFGASNYMNRPSFSANLGLWF
ncbi:MAG: patatin-like phospholipase family protein [Mangrovibacterium sp.]